MIGLLGILSGLVGQAMFWGIFKGSVVERLKAHESVINELRERTDNDVKTLEETDRSQWNKLDEHGQRIAVVEAQCKIRHRRWDDQHMKEEGEEG